MSWLNDYKIAKQYKMKITVTKTSGKKKLNSDHSRLKTNKPAWDFAVAHAFGCECVQ